MTRIVVADGMEVVVLEPEAPTRCEFCHELRETRPYGPGGKRICFPCSQSTPELKDATIRNFAYVLEGQHRGAS